MKKRTERTLKELYGITERILEPKITPVLEGSYRIQGPVEESDPELWRLNSGILAEKKFKSVDKSIHMEVETGTCNVCYAPCSSCLHNNHTMSGMESKFECGSSQNPCAKKAADDCSFVHVDSQHAVSETSKVHSPSSSHDSYSENAESMVTLSPSFKCETTEDLKGDGLFSSNNTSDMCYRMRLSPDEDQYGLEFNENNISCMTGIGDSDIGVDHHKVGLDEKNASTNTILANDIGTSTARDEPTDGFHASANEERQSNCRKQIICPEESLQMNNGISSTEVMHSSTINKEFKVPSSLVLEGGNSESDAELTDVNVCDICGDAGREDLLAFCSSCSDGAEHTYCMREKLSKIPDGDWLCEECQLKEEAEMKKVDSSEKVFETARECKLNENVAVEMDRSEKVSLTAKACKPMEDIDHKKVDKSPKLSCLNETSQNLRRTSSMKLMSKLDMKAIDSEERGVPTIMQSPRVSAKSHANSQEDVSFNNKRPPETSGEPIEIGSPRKRIALSRETSFKNMDINRVQSANSFKALSRSQSTLGSYSLKHQPQLQPQFGFIQRSRSFNNSNTKLKVKHLTENVSVKPKMTRKSSMNETRKELSIPVKPKLTREFSSDNTREESPVISLTKSMSFKSIGSGRRYSGSASKTRFFQHSPINSSQRVGSSFPSPKVDMKSSLHDLKLYTLSGSNMFKKNKGSDDANGLGRKEAKKLSTYSKTLGSTSPKANCNSEDQRACEGAHGSSSSIKKSYSKTKESNILSNSRQAVSGGNQTLRCQKCNETGHTTQFCSINKVTLTDGNINKEGSKCKEDLKPTVSKNRIQKNGKKSDCLEEFSVSSSFNCRRDMPLLVGKSDDQETLRSPDVGPVKTTVVADVGLYAFQLVEASCTPQASELKTTSATSDELNLKPSSHILHDQALVFANRFRTTAIPERRSIWQGVLEVLSSGNGPTLFDGFQAHLSNCASPGVLEIVTKLPCRVQLEEVSCNGSWPLQSQGISPNEDNIALFFFAEDVESYETSYSKLFEKMFVNDLVLKGIVDGVELFILPSNKLPLHSQRWNRLFFLWGIFKGMVTDSSTSGPMINKNSSVLDLSCALSSVVSNSQNIVSVDSTDNESPRFDKPPEVEDKMCRAQAYPHVHVSSFQSDADNKFQLDLNSIDQFSDDLDAHAKSRFEMVNTQPYSEVKSEDTYLRNLCNDSGGICVVAPPTTANEQIVHSRASLSFSASSCLKGMESSGSKREIGKHEISPKSEAIFYDDIQLSLEERSNKKRAYLTRSSDETMLFKDKDREVKRLCYREGYDTGSFKEENLTARSSSKVYPLLTSFLNEQHKESKDAARFDTVITGSRVFTAEKFFPVEPCTLLSTKSDNLVHILSTDDEDVSESNTPNLELDLGGTWKALDRPLNKLIDDEILPSLSLSLAIPTAEKEWPTKPIVKSEQHFQDRPDINTSLVL